MADISNFTQHILDGYTFSDDYITLGGAMLDGQTVKGLHIKAPLRMFNRHGLIAGATGTGKTKTIQVLSEQLAAKGIPVLMMDIKGDFSGIAMPGEEKSFITELVRISSFSQNVCLDNIIDRELNNVDVYLDYAKKQVEYRFDEGLYKQDPSKFMDFARVFSWRIMRYVTLLRDLEKEGMLFLYQESPNVPNSRFGRLIKGSKFIASGLNDSQAISSILEYTKRTILINQSLLDFESNNFKSYFIASSLL